MPDRAEECLQATDRLCRCGQVGCTARHAGVPLLFKGGDFSQTDITAA